MSDLRDRLARLGVPQYFEVFVAEGFDTWDTILDITESDLSHLSVKLGHRRKLQRAIAESRGQSADRPLPISLGRAASVEGSYRSDDSGPEGKGKQGEASTGVSGTATKRKYRRHPKPDEHAPERPPSAYVIFSNQVRESLKGQELTFTEMAKVVGEKWQVLPADERESCERQANVAKEKYYADLADYKKTPHYDTYQRYLEDFRAKHAAPMREAKRSKLETGTSTPIQSSSHDQHERAANRRLSSVQPEPPAGYQVSAPSSPIGPARLPAGPAYSSMPISPATHSLSESHSPRMGDRFSPASLSPRFAAMQREAFFETSSVNPARDPRGSADTNLPHHSYMEPHHQPASTTSPSYSYMAHYQNRIDSHSRRPLRDVTRLPPLSHEDTTLSSESGHSGHNVSLAGYPGQSFPADSVKTLRMLPQPVPTTGPLPSPLDRPPPPPAALPLRSPSSQFQPPPRDQQLQGPLTFLVRAGEIASGVVDVDKEMEKEGSS